jgi:hypothetical protein
MEIAELTKSFEFLQVSLRVVMQEALLARQIETTSRNEVVKVVNELSQKVEDVSQKLRVALSQRESDAHRIDALEKAMEESSIQIKDDATA